jgi:hypothetical protein
MAVAALIPIGAQTAKTAKHPGSSQRSSRIFVEQWGACGEKHRLAAQIKLAIRFWIFSPRSDPALPKPPNW